MGSIKERLQTGKRLLCIQIKEPEICTGAYVQTYVQSVFQIRTTSPQNLHLHNVSQFNAMSLFLSSILHRIFYVNWKISLLKIGNRCPLQKSNTFANANSSVRNVRIHILPERLNSIKLLKGSRKEIIFKQCSFETNVGSILRYVSPWIINGSIWWAMKRRILSRIWR